MLKLCCRLPASLALLLQLTACSDGVDSSFEAVAEPANFFYDDCKLAPDEIEIFSTGEGLEFVRTPDACFQSLDGFDYPANSVDVGGLRMGYIDEGPADGEVVLMLHGQPSWSYLYRRMIPVLVEAGYRVIAADHVGMGRSDKPVDPRDHQYEQQVVWNKAFISALGLSNITLFVQDWGSLIGLRIAGDMPELFARIVVANGDLPIIPPGLNPFTVPVFEIDESLGSAQEFFSSRSPERVAGFQQWINYAAGAPVEFAADVVELGSVVELSPAQEAAYVAPFPSQIYRGAIRAFPSMIAGIEDQNQPAYDALGEFDRPFLFLAGEFDPNLGSEQNQQKWIDHVPGARGQDHRRYPAGHFIQEDVGVEMAAQVVDFMQANPIPVAGPLYLFRYCEILLFEDDNGQARADVYNTGGLNFCPQEQWDAIDADQVAQENGAEAAGKNGPRFWVLDWIAQGDPANAPPPLPGFGQVKTFGEIDMRLVASVLLPPGSMPGETAYKPNEVDRNTVFTYVAGRRVYELFDPDGGRYIMQSFSQIVDPDLEVSDLATLDERLELPPGWTWNTRILAEEFQLATVDGLAIVVTDDFSNTYQKID